MGSGPNPKILVLTPSWPAILEPQAQSVKGGVKVYQRGGAKLYQWTRSMIGRGVEVR